jgi:hypothetical protein
VFESKWGFHPVSRETCAKLKKAHKLLLRAYRDIRKLDRWNNKLNPVGEKPIEPPFCEYGNHLRKGEPRYGYHMETIDGTTYGTSIFHYVLRCYRVARRPVESADLVQDVRVPGDLDSMIAKLEEFYTVV